MLTKKKSILIYVQHLLGSGHLVRAFRLAKGLADAGHQVHLVSGGLPVPHLQIDEAVAGNDDFHWFQLPPMQSKDAAFSAYVDAYGKPIDARWQSTRKTQLLNYVSQYQFDVAIIETYPFGRRQMRFELTPLLDWLKSEQVYICASIRDVLQQRKQARYLETVELVSTYFDKVIVHADDDFVDLSASFPMADKIADKLFYSGYIYDQRFNEDSEQEDSRQGVIVSAGGSVVGLSLLKTAIEAKPLSVLHQEPWVVRYSPKLAVEDIALLHNMAAYDRGIVVEPNKPDYLALLKHKKVSLSQAGYNTALDVLASNIASVMVPFSGYGETEQKDRAHALSLRGYCVTLDEQLLTPGSLARAIAECQLIKRRSNFSMPDMQGVENTCRFITQLP